MKLRAIIVRWTGVGLVLASFIGFLMPQSVEASQITSRSLTLEAGTDPGSKPGGVVDHEFKFTLPTAGNVGSLMFQYCLTPADTGALTCTTPTGLDTTAATIVSQTGISGFTIDNSVNGSPKLELASTTSISANTAVDIVLGTITNPTTTNQTFYVRITSYASLNATGAVTDNGSVAASTATQIVLTGIMPESLVFCTGAAINTTGGVPDCTTASAGAVNFDRLFSPTDTAIAQSQMAASTNATQGYVISVFGNTLQSGSNSIAKMGTATTGVHGTAQFGMNLKANTAATSSPAVGIEVAPSDNGSNYRGQAMAGYNSVDNFQFNSGDNIANSANPSAAGSDAQIFTSAYIVNVPGSQPAGTYTTTLTYICTPSF